MKNFLKMTAVFGLGVFVGKIKSIEFTSNTKVVGEDVVELKGDNITHGLR